MVRSLEDAITAAGGALAHLRSHKYDRNGPPAYSPGLIIPQVPYEFSNWYREGQAFRKTVALFDQTHHMNSVHLRGSDALKFVRQLVCNNLDNTAPGRAHQMVVCNEEGSLLGENILFNFAPDHLYLVGVPFAMNWVRYKAESTSLRVEAIPSLPRSPVYANGHANEREHCRFQIQGPNAWRMIEALNGGPVADVKFFHMTEIKIAGRTVQALRHGMAGAPGLEVWAPYELRDELRETMIDVGREFGLVQVGAGAYLIGGVESAYIQWCVPAIFSGESTAGYRRWLSADELEGQLRLTGSHSLSRVEDYYMTPYQFGYGHLVDLGHDFVGRDALSRMDPAKAKKKVTILWNADDAADLFGEMLRLGGDRVRPIHLPVATDKTDVNYDTLTLGDKVIGTAHVCAYSPSERSLISVGLVNTNIEIGAEVVLHWGEAGGGYGDSVVEPDAIRPIRGIASPAPYARVAREDYAAGWRTRSRPAG